MTRVSPEAILLPTKLSRPRLVDDLVPRTRLLKKLDATLRSRLLLVAAPAGFGKSTLVAWWLAQSPDVVSAWVSLDEHDNSLASFVGYCIAAVESRFPGVCGRLRGMNDAVIPPLPTAQALALAEELEALPADMVLVLDDFHTIKAPEILELMEQLLLHMPERLHLVLVSRQDPALPLARLRVQQELVDIRASDLRFRHDETVEFFRRAIGDTLSPELVTLLDQRAEGWIAGLRIAAISMHDADEPDVVARSLAGMQRHVMDFLMEQVLAQQPPALRDFLLRTSILERFTAPLCDAVLAGNRNDREGRETPAPAPISAAAALQMLEASNLFLVPLDDERRWYRYHNLFRDLLRHRLQVEAHNDAILTLYVRAAEWLESNGYYEEAMHAYLAVGRGMAAAEMVEQNAAYLLDNESNQLLQHWLSLLPASTIARRPVLLVARAWVHSVHAEWAAIPPLLQQAVAVQAQDESSVPEALAVRLRSEIDALWCHHWFLHGQIERAIAHGRDAIECLTEGDTLPRGYAGNFVAIALSISGRRPQALEFLRTQLANEPPLSGTRIRLLFGLSIIQMSGGNYQAAFNAAKEVLKLATAQQRTNTQGWGHYILGTIYLCWNDLALAQQHFEAAIAMRYLVNARMYQDSLHGLALVQAAQGAYADAEITLETALEFAVENLQAVDCDASRALQVALALEQGSPVDEIYMERPPLVPGVNLWLEERRLIYARLLCARGRPAELAEAEQLLQDLVEGAEVMQDMHHLPDMLVEQALLYCVTDRPDLARAALNRAVATAKTGGAIRPFLHGGERLAALLRQVTEGDAAAQFVRRILEALPPAVEQPERRRPAVLQHGDELLELLTERELEVLHLLADRLSDKEIAQALVISPLTVRKHTSNIFDKLQVHSRRQAVARAAALGLLSVH